MKVYDKMVALVTDEAVPMNKDYADAADYFEEYKQWTDTTAKYPNPDTNLLYPLLGLQGETGEFLDKFFDINDADLDNEAVIEAVSQELGDVLWYLARVAKYFDVPMIDIMGFSELVGDGAIKYAALMVKKHNKNVEALITHTLYRLTQLFLLNMESFKKIERGDVSNDPQKYEEKLIKGLTGVGSLFTAVLFTYSLVKQEQPTGLVSVNELKRVCELNKAKLMARLETGKIKGDGDAR